MWMFLIVFVVWCELPKFETKSIRAFRVQSLQRKMFWVQVLVLVLWWGNDYFVTIVGVKTRHNLVVKTTIWLSKLHWGVGLHMFLEGIASPYSSGSYVYHSSASCLLLLYLTVPNEECMWHKPEFNVGFSELIGLAKNIPLESA